MGIDDFEQWSRRNALSVLDAVADVVISIDVEGRVLYTNSAIEELFGYQAEELLGEPVARIMPEGFAGQHQSHVSSYLATGKSGALGHSRELLGLRKNGEQVPLQVTVNELTTEDGTHFAGVLRDLTEQNERQVSLHRQREQMARIARLSTMGEMTASIAHEMNQPLTAIAMYAQACERMLRQSSPDREKLLDALNKLSDQALRAGAVNERVQQFARSEGGPKEALDINLLMQDIRPLAAGDARAHGIELQYKLGEGLPLVLCSGINMQQVVVNLLRNAFDAMAEISCENGNDVVLSTELVEGEAGELQTPSETGSYVRVSVSDDGPGISAEVARTLFNPFQTSKLNGMGLGLSTCRGLIEDEGGQLEYENRPGYGVTFFFTIPVHRAEGNND